MKILCPILFLFLFTSTALGQHELTGTIREAGSKESIPGASISILGTSRGAKANNQGKYRLQINGERVRLRVFAIGYKPDTITLTAPFPTSRDIELRVSPVVGADVVVSADQSRVEARRIMRKVIETKETWQPLIDNYTFDVYARLNARRISGGDTSIMSIIESSAKAYWDRERGYAERIVARKQTANLPASANVFSLLGIVNFYDERISLPDYTVVSPIARDAFDRYDYDLLGTVEINGSNSYKILVEPRGSIVPAFNGTLYIDQDDYSVTYLSLTPNKAVKIGPLREGRIEQVFRLVDNKYWMPAESKFFIKAEFALPVVPAFTIEHTGVLQNYAINAGVPDSVFEGYGRSVDPMADSVSEVAWSEMRVIPLNADESGAYSRLDSVAALPREPQGFSPVNELIGLVLGGTPMSFNRAEGLRLEIGTSIEKFANWPLSLNAKGAYGTADKKFKYNIGLRQALLWSDVRKVQTTVSSNGDFVADIVDDIRPVLSLGAGLFDDKSLRGEAYGKIPNTITSLLFRSDYPDYYRSKGGYGEIVWAPAIGSEYSLMFLNERQSTVQQYSDFTLFNRDKGYRPNPPIVDGLYRALELSISQTVLSNLSVGVNAKLSDSSFGGDFNFSSISGSLDYSVRLPSIGKTTLLASASAIVSGIAPVQHLFTFESHNAYLSTPSVFRTMGPRQFEGDRAWSAMLEQNFYDLPVRALGLTFLEPLDLHWIGFINAAQSVLTAETRRSLIHPVNTTGDTPYVEAGFGLANIFNIVRFDAAWRVTHRRESNGFVSISFGTSF